jgi:hypothetical protein
MDAMAKEGRISFARSPLKIESVQDTLDFIAPARTWTCATPSSAALGRLRTSPPSPAPNEADF